MSEISQACPKCGGTIGPDAPQGLCPKCLLQQASFPTETGAAARHGRLIPPTREALAAAFPQLEILELIGQGGMGFVFKARQPKLDRVVALKILAQPLAEQTSFAERFTREGRTLAKLNHPNIVTIHDFGQAGPFFYLLMEYVDGVNLRQAMRAGAFTAQQALAIVPKICEALQYAHNEGVLHRDIKPDNILMDTRGRVKIADFGIAKLMADVARENPLTGTGSSLGTPHYMAPEQIERPDAVDHRADIFSLGVVFYEMLTGELPLGRFAAPSEKSAVDPRLDQIVFQTLEKQPEKRPQSAEEVKTRVEGVASGKGEPAAAGPCPRGTAMFRNASCYISTPEHLRTFFGKISIYTGRGELRLDDEELVFTRGNQSVVMPLGDITSVARGQYPRLTKPTGLDYIAVTFRREAGPSRVLLTPHKSRWAPTWETNSVVNDWLGSIRQAVQAKTGKAPGDSAEKLEPLANASFPNHGTKIAFGLAALVLGALLLAAFLFFRRRDIDDPGRAERASKALSAEHARRHDEIPRDPARAIKADSLARYERTITLRSFATLFADEKIRPVIRYADGPWVSNEATAHEENWAGGKSSLEFSWSLPEPFTPGFDVMAALERMRFQFGQGHVEFFEGEVAPLFSATNGFGQIISGGLQYERSARALAPDARAELSFQDASGGDRSFIVTLAGELPDGTFLQGEYWQEPAAGSPAVRALANHRRELQMWVENWSLIRNPQSQRWTHPIHLLKDNLRGKNWSLPLDAKTEIFSVTNYVYRQPQGTLPSAGSTVIATNETGLPEIDWIMRGYLELKRKPARP